MEQLIKQVRVRYSGQGSTEEPGSIKERRIPSPKHTSSKEGKKRSLNWFQRQFSRQMNRDYDSNGMENVTAVAAAAYAITSLEELSFPERKKISKDPEPSFTWNGSKKEDKTVSISEPGDGPVRYPASTDSKLPETPVAVVGAAPRIKRTLTFTDKTTPSMTKTPTFADTSLNSTNDVKPQSAESKTDFPAIKPEIATPKPDLPTLTKPATPPTKTQRQSLTRPGIGEAKADAWERDELAKIQKRYEQLHARILSWENKKKTKAKRRLDKKESELAEIRSKSLIQFRSEMDDIDQIAGGARAKAADRQRNEEFKAKEKANTIRKTGKVPRTCFCF